MRNLLDRNLVIDGASLHWWYKTEFQFRYFTSIDQASDSHRLEEKECPQCFITSAAILLSNPSHDPKCASGRNQSPFMNEGLFWSSHSMIQRTVVGIATVIVLSAVIFSYNFLKLLTLAQGTLLLNVHHVRSRCLCFCDKAKNHTLSKLTSHLVKQRFLPWLSLVPSAMFLRLTADTGFLIYLCSGHPRDVAD